MAAIDGALLCLGYIVGLLLTGLPNQELGWVVGGALLVGAIATVAMPRLWRTGPRARLWLVAGLIAALAPLYFQWRLPHEATTDLSQWVQSAETREVTVSGTIRSTPQLTRSQRIQFELETARANEQPGSETPVTGTLYVTIPLLQATGLYPGSTVTITGQLYRPKPAENPGGFDFQAYLAQKGIFAGLNGKTVVSQELGIPPSLGDRLAKPLAHIRQRIVRSQVLGLGMPGGALVSVMVLGRNGVDLPYGIKDQFVSVGLAHALAASGAQVSMLVGVVALVSQRLPSLWRLGLSSSILMIYVGLTGFQPAVLRAAIMGLAALVALTLERKTHPLGLVLATASALLVYNPLWIWDLGFQLSFLATLGLLVTTPAILRRLDWMPSTLAPLLAVPIAAYVWTLPLQLHIFGVVSPYTIPVNILTTPLIAMLSIGGMVSASVGLVSQTAGSMAAQALYWPAHALLALVNWSAQLPGVSYSVGTLSALQVSLIYGLYLLPFCRRRGRRVWLVAAAGACLIGAPFAIAAQSDRLVFTILSTEREAVMVLQNGGHTGLVNSGDESDVQFTVLPFLQQHGVNHLSWAIAPAPTSAWLRVLQRYTIDDFYHAPQVAEDAEFSVNLNEAIAAHPIRRHDLSPKHPFEAGAFQVQPLSPTALQFQLEGQRWLLTQFAAEQTPPQIILPQADILWWSGAEPSVQMLDAVQPQVAIASAYSVSESVQAALQTLGCTLFITGRDGAIEGSPNQEFHAVLARAEP